MCIESINVCPVRVVSTLQFHNEKNQFNFSVKFTAYCKHAIISTYVHTLATSLLNVDQLVQCMNN